MRTRLQFTSFSRGGSEQDQNTRDVAVIAIIHCKTDDDADDDDRDVSPL